MRQLTLRGFDGELERRIRQLARRGAGLGQSCDKPETVGDSLDHLIGTWTAEEASEFDRALEDFSRIDEEMWR